ncbi:MAG: CBS domain-containing protein, partial [Rhodoblastus sp.]
YAGGMKHVVVTRGERLVGVIRVNMELHCGVEQADPGVRVGDIAQKNFVIAHENDIMFDIVSHMARRRASTAVVIADKLRPRAQNVVGIITREHIGDSVAEGLKPYG